MSDNESAKVANRRARPANIRVETLTPLFKLVFLTILGLTILALALNVILVASIANPNDQAKGLIDMCSTIVKTGFGAIVGLIGGKSV